MPSVKWDHPPKPSTENCDQLSSQRDHQQKQRYRDQDQIEWRRSQVLELSSQGQTERQIATVLQVGKTTVHKDLAYLSRQAKENLKTHIQDKLPEEYQKSMVGINQVLNIAWSIVNRYISINPVFDKLVTSLRTAIEDNGILDKETTSYNDVFDAFRLALRYYKINQGEKEE